MDDRDFQDMIPGHWSVSRVKHHFSIVLGKMRQRDCRQSDDELKPYLKAANLAWAGPRVDSTESMWFSALDRKRLQLQVGDLLVSEGGDIGKSCIWHDELPECYIEKSVNRVRQRDRISTKFLYYWLYSLKMIGLVDAVSNTSTLSHYTADKLANTPMVLPPPSEADAIVDFLDRETARIDALIAKQWSLIELMYEKRLAAVSTAFQRGGGADHETQQTGIPWYPRAPQCWNMTKVKRHFSVELGKMLDEKRFSLGGAMMPYLRTANLGWDQIDLSDVSEMPFQRHEFDRYSTRPGDLLVCEGGDAGRTTFWRQQWGTMMIQKAINRVRAIGDVDPRFAYYWFWYVKHIGGVDWMCNGTTILHFTADKVKETPLPVPPTAEEQRGVTSHLDELFGATEVALENARRLMSTLEERRNALVSAAVTGAIDVRNWGPLERETVLRD